jgi:hypothetical protein
MIEQDDPEAGYGHVRVRNAEKMAYRNAQGKVWYFTGTISGRKLQAGAAVAATFQLDDKSS